MKNKATHNGTCQCCGNSQAVSPYLSNHGYTVDFGYFNGICRGANEAPLEESRELCDKLVKELRAESTRLANLKSEDVKSVFIRVSNNGFRQHRKEATANVTCQKDIDLLCEQDEQAELWKRYYGTDSYDAKYSGNNFEAKVEAEVRMSHIRATRMAEHANAMEKRADETTGRKELEPRECEKPKVRFTIPCHRRDKEGAKEGWDRVKAMKDSGDYARVTTRRNRYDFSHNVVATPK